jgi:MOSC domain-containing protein YiiM
MFQGHLIGIYLTSQRGAPMVSVAQVEAVAGRGLCGDRYFLPEGKNKPDKEVTLIEVEALEALPRDYQMSLPPDQVRRNLLTRGVPLNNLIGKEFTIGEVLLRGVELCEPCGHLEKLTFSGVKKALVHRGGLRAQLLRGGILKVQDPIREVS